MVNTSMVSAGEIYRRVQANWKNAPQESEARYMWYQVLRELSTLAGHNLEAHRYLLQERLAHVSGVSRRVVEQALALFGEEELEA
jgi:heme oxygenase